MVLNIKYSNGGITITVENFFLVSSIPNIKQLFKLVKQHCSEPTKQQLLADLYSAQAYWDNWYDQFCHGKVIAKHMWQPTTPAQLKNVQKKFNKVIKIWSETYDV